MPYLPRQTKGAGREPYPLAYLPTYLPTSYLLPLPVNVATNANTATAIK